MRAIFLLSRYVMARGTGCLSGRVYAVRVFSVRDEVRRAITPAGTYAFLERVYAAILPISLQGIRRISEKERRITGALRYRVLPATYCFGYSI